MRLARFTRVSCAFPAAKRLTNVPTEKISRSICMFSSELTRVVPCALTVPLYDGVIVDFSTMVTASINRSHDQTHKMELAPERHSTVLGITLFP
jgi:hypothetical protein